MSEELNIERILIPVDFSDTSRKAFYVGLRFARIFDADTHVLHVEGPLHSASDPEKVSEAVARLEDAEEQARQRWSTVTNGLERTSNNLDAGMTQYSQQVNSHLSGALSEFDQGLSSAVGALSSGIANLLDLVESIQQAIQLPADEDGA